MSLTIKAFFEKTDGETEIRRFTVPADVSSSNEYLSKKIQEIYPALAKGNFSLFWKDEDHDYIKFSSDEELMSALSFRNGDVFRVFIREYHIDNTDSETGTEPGYTHPNVVCDNCDGPVIGTRYKCYVCTDYDLCSTCEASGAHAEHEMLKIPTPKDSWMGYIPPPPHFRRWMNRFMRRWQRNMNGQGQGADGQGSPEETPSAEGTAGTAGQSTGPEQKDETPQEDYLKGVGASIASMLDPFGIDVTYEVHTDDKPQEGSAPQQPPTGPQVPPGAPPPPFGPPPHGGPPFGGPHGPFGPNPWTFGPGAHGGPHAQFGGGHGHFGPHARAWAHGMAGAHGGMAGGPGMSCSFGPHEFWMKGGKCGGKGPNGDWGCKGKGKGGKGKGQNAKEAQAPSGCKKQNKKDTPAQEKTTPMETGKPTEKPAEAAQKDTQEQTTPMETEKTADIIDLSSFIIDSTDSTPSTPNDAEWTVVSPAETQMNEDVVTDGATAPRPAVIPMPTPQAPVPAQTDIAQPSNPKVAHALTQLEAMGFNNECGWLTNLLESKDGDIGQVLDLILQAKRVNANGEYKA